MEEVSTIIYDIDLYTIFRKLDNCKLASIQDPKGISGYIQACSTDNKKADALSKLNSALKRAKWAREARDSDKIRDAFYWWDLLFNGNFPSYYY